MLVSILCNYDDQIARMIHVYRRVVLRRVSIFAGSKDEAFFDSQPWLESDCEDDFLSVNGGKKPTQQAKYILLLLEFCVYLGDNDTRIGN